MILSLSPWKKVGWLVLTLACLLAHAPARAQSSSAHARVLFGEARKLMDKGRFEEACPKLEESLRLDHGMGTQFNLAHCWEKLGRTASAWGLFLDVASAANAAGQSKRETAARERASALEPQLARLLIEVKEPPSELTVVRDGDVVGRAAWGTAMPVDPGTHKIEASAPGKRMWTEEIKVEAPGETVTIAIPRLEDELDEPPLEPDLVETRPAPTPDEKDTGGLSTSRILTSTIFAVVGVGGIVAGTLYGLEANSETAAARALCVGGTTGNVCDRDSALADFDGGARELGERENHRENADRAALIGYIGWGVGAAGLVASAVVLLTAPDEPDEAGAASLEVVPLVTSDSVGTVLSGRF